MAEVKTEDAAQAGGASDTVTLVVSREEAAFIDEGMQMLLNANRFRFKDPHKDIRDLFPDIFAAVESVQGKVKQALETDS